MSFWSPSDRNVQPDDILVDILDGVKLITSGLVRFSENERFMSHIRLHLSPLLLNWDDVGHILYRLVSGQQK